MNNKTQPSIQEMNVEIARMLGWKYITWQEEKSDIYSFSIKAGWYSTVPKILQQKINGHLYKARNHNELRFNDDANWQFEALDWIKKQGYTYALAANKKHCSCVTHSVVSSGKCKNEKEAIFEALYQFSQYIKSKK